jgi:uncharacterized protein YfaS (alpha-2-macroglobulin family)
MPHEHDHALDLVDPYLHEALEPADAEWVESHCESCPVCKVALEEARKRFAVLATVPASEASEQLVQTTLERIGVAEQYARRRRRLLWWGVMPVAAAVLLTLGGLHTYYGLMRPSPYEIVVLGQNQLLSGSPASLRVRVLNRSTGLPLAQVPVDILLAYQGRGGGGWNHGDELASFTTDTDGSGQPRFVVPDPGNWQDGDLRLRVIAHVEGKPEELLVPITLKRSWKLMLSSDKPLYQPGQEIHLRSLALQTSTLRPVAGQETTFSITDPKGNVIFKRKDVTSPFGIAWADCPLATEIIEGPYQIACKVGDTESRLTVEVKKYVLPKFKVEVTGLKPYYQPGERFIGTVQARYFFGKPVAGAEVKLALASTDVGVTRKEQILTTDDDGRAEFRFKLPETLVGRETDAGDARCAIEVAVTDRAGQKYGTTVSKVVTSQPLRFQVIPEGGTLVRAIANKVYLFATYADGTPAQVTVNVSGVDKELRTSSLGVAAFEITPSVENVALTIKATDADNRVARQTLTLACGTSNQDFILRTDKAVYEGGQTVQLTAFGSGTEPVFVDLIKDGQTVLTESLALTNGRGAYQFDLPLELFGTIEINAYRFPPAPQATAVVLPVRKSRVIYVRAVSQVRIQAKLDRDEYRPGEKAKIKFQLTDALGKPTPGALSLAAVDEALFALLDRAPGMERSFYLLEQELLQPVYTIYPWSPDAAAGAVEDRVQLEQALFARTARAEVGGETPVRPAIVGQVPRGTPYSLSALSFPAKVQQVAQVRTAGLRWVWIAWGLLASLGLIAGYISIWVVAPKAMAIVHAVIASVFGIIGVGYFLGCAGLLVVGLGLGFVAAIAAAQDKPPHPLVILTASGLLLLIGLAPIALFGTNERYTATAWNARRSTGADEEAAPLQALSRVITESKDTAPAEAIVLTNEPKPALTQDYSSSKTKIEAAQHPVRVRDWFPETLLWKPQFITNDQGEYTLDVKLADSITAWRLTASAVTSDGRLGAMQAPLTVFQPFFVDLDLPVTLTRGDEVALRVVVHNYHKEPGPQGKSLPQTVALSLADADWFERLEPNAKKTVELGPNEQKTVMYRIRVTRVGRRDLQVHAQGAGVGDAIQRTIEVVPDGRRVEQVVNGTLDRPTNLTLTVPAAAIEGSPKAIVKIYPSNFSQLVEGLDAIFQMPSGCFEQTSSTTYPNVLALDYLRRTKKTVPDVEAKAKQYIQLGYQRLLGFEVSGGGFDWFGRPPANRVLTAYGLMEFQDMAKVHDVDPNLIARTRQWLLAQRGFDGGWQPESHEIHGGPGEGRHDAARLATTAYIAWAVFAEQRDGCDATRTYLLNHRPETIANPYVLALICNALRVIDPSAAAPYLARLDALKSADDKFVSWKQASNSRTAFYSAGVSGDIETTALAVLALLPIGEYTGSCRGGLAWLAKQKDAAGTWHSTQATVLALKALLAGTQHGPGDRERRIDLTFGQGPKQTIVIPPHQGDVMKQLDLSPLLATGDNALSLAETSGSGAGFQVSFHYHVPAEAEPKRPEPLAIRVEYDKTELTVDESILATATVTNRMTTAAPMVMLELPIPAGFTLDAGELAELVGQKKIARYQIGAGRATVYLLGLQPGQTLELKYTLQARLPVKVTAPAARVYEYYDPQKQGVGTTAQLTVKPRG